jgi:hypothetical protein
VKIVGDGVEYEKQKKIFADEKENNIKGTKNATYIYHDGILCEYLMVIAFQKP